MTEEINFKSGVDEKTGVRVGILKTKYGEIFTPERAAISTESNYLRELIKSGIKKPFLASKIFFGISQVDVEAIIKKDNQYYQGKVKSLKTHLSKTNNCLKIFKPVLGVFKAYKDKDGKWRKRFLPIGNFYSAIEGYESWIIKNLVSLATDSSYDILDVPYNNLVFKYQNFVDINKIALKERDELVNIGEDKVEIIPNIPLSALSNSNFETSAKWAINDGNFAGIDFTYAGRYKGRYNYISLKKISKENDNTWFINSDVPRRILGKNNFLSAPHYSQLWGCDTSVRAMPFHFLRDKKESVQDKEINEIKAFQKSTLGIIDATKILISWRGNVSTKCPFLNKYPRDYLLNKANSYLLDTFLKIIESFDSCDEMKVGRDYAANNEFTEYIKQRKYLKETYVKENLSQERLI